MTLNAQIEQQLLLPERIEKVNALLEKRAIKLEQRKATAETELDQKRIERLEGRIDRAERIRDELTGQLNSDELAPLKDEFSIRPEVVDGMGRFYVTIVNSPYDNTYVPNDPLVLGYRGCQKNPVNASSRCSNRRGSFANGDYWKEDPVNTMELWSGSSGFSRIINDYDLSFLAIAVDMTYGSGWVDQPGKLRWIYDEMA